MICQVVADIRAGRIPADDNGRPVLDHVPARQRDGYADILRWLDASSITTSRRGRVALTHDGDAYLADLLNPGRYTSTGVYGYDRRMAGTTVAL